MMFFLIAFALASFTATANAALECSASDFPHVSGVAWDPVIDDRLTGYRIYINGAPTAEIAPDDTEAYIGKINVIEGSNALYVTAFGADPEIESGPSNVVEVMCRKSELPSTTLRLTADATPQSVTAGKETFAVWDNPTTAYRDLMGATEFLVRVDADIDENSSGILFEIGGENAGSVLYVHDGTLYLQCGNGKTFGHADDRGEATWKITKSNPVVEAHCTLHKAALYVDGAMVSSDDFSAWSVGGGNPGGISGNGTAHPATRMATSGIASPYNGAIRSVTFYKP